MLERLRWPWSRRRCLAAEQQERVDRFASHSDIAGYNGLPFTRSTPACSRSQTHGPILGRLSQHCSLSLPVSRTNCLLLSDSSQPGPILHLSSRNCFSFALYV